MSGRKMSYTRRWQCGSAVESRSIQLGGKATGGQPAYPNTARLAAMCHSASITATQRQRPRWLMTTRDVRICQLTSRPCRIAEADGERKRAENYNKLAAPTLDTRPCISRFALGPGFVCRKVTTSAMLTQRSCCLLQRLSVCSRTESWQ